MNRSLAIAAAFAMGLGLTAAHAAADTANVVRALETAPMSALRQAHEPEAVQAIPRAVVPFSGGHAPGSIIVDTAARRLYFVLEGGKAVRYAVGVARPGMEWSGEQAVTAMRQWPDWRPPAEMLKRRPDLPRFMEGGPDNPLGARALYLGSSLYRIHGSNEPQTIGQAVSSGCIRMTNEDVVDLYARVRVGARVVVLR
jgi:lipoprotein-anchoring transpeptidase ErfK/SrfK